MKPKSIAIAGMLLSPFIETVLVVSQGDARNVMDAAGVMASVASLGSLFMWLHYDGLQYGYGRTALFNIAIFLLPIIFVPVYIYLSRPPGARGAAFLRLLGFCLLWMGAMALSQVVILLIFFGHDLL